MRIADCCDLYRIALLNPMLLRPSTLPCHTSVDTTRHQTRQKICVRSVTAHLDTSREKWDEGKKKKSYRLTIWRIRQSRAQYQRRRRCSVRGDLWVCSLLGLGKKKTCSVRWDLWVSLLLGLGKKQRCSIRVHKIIKGLLFSFFLKKKVKFPKNVNILLLISKEFHQSFVNFQRIRFIIHVPKIK